MERKESTLISMDVDLSVVRTDYVQIEPTWGRVMTDDYPRHERRKTKRSCG